MNPIFASNPSILIVTLSERFSYTRDLAEFIAGMDPMLESRRDLEGEYYEAFLRDFPDEDERWKFRGCFLYTMTEEGDKRWLETWDDAICFFLDDELGMEYPEEEREPDDEEYRWEPIVDTILERLKKFNAAYKPKCKILSWRFVRTRMAEEVIAIDGKRYDKAGGMS